MATGGFFWAAVSAWTAAKPCVMQHKATRIRRPQDRNEEDAMPIELRCFATWPP